jgi:hypothetical protein
VESRHGPRDVINLETLAPTSKLCRSPLPRSGVYLEVVIEQLVQSAGHASSRS